MRRALMGFAEGVPCDDCSAHFTRHVATMPGSALDGRTDLLRWVIDTHNAVNLRLGKRAVPQNVAMAMIADKFEEKKKFPTWAIALIVITLAVAAGSGIAYATRRASGGPRSSRTKLV